MGIIVGIDEAGYGPTLGPLIVSATVWRIDDAHDGDALREVDLWRRLTKSIATAASSSAARLIVGDSKEVFDRKHGLGPLERPVLAFARAAGQNHATLNAFLTGLGDGDAPSRSRMPWYQAADRSLPVDRVGGAPGVAGERLPERMAAAGITCLGLLSEIVTEDAYNARLSATRNKSAVLVEHVLRLMLRALRRAAGAPVAFVVDRLGGRSNYRQILHDVWPDREICELATNETISRYRLSRPAGPKNAATDAENENLWAEFVVEADKQHLPVALASMLSKYVRELLMEQFNDYWRRLAPHVRPTAGYYTDAQRFLIDIAPHLTTAGLTTEMFVRAR